MSPKYLINRAQVGGVNAEAAADEYATGDAGGTPSYTADEAENIELPATSSKPSLSDVGYHFGTGAVSDKSIRAHLTTTFSNPVQRRNCPRSVISSSVSSW